MANCIKCNKENCEYNFHVIEVHTLHVRGLKESRVQALGDWKDYSVCKECAAKKLASLRNPMSHFFKDTKWYILTLFLGLFLLLFLWDYEWLYRFMGFAGILCFVLGMYAFVRDSVAVTKEFKKYTEEQALSVAAWQCMIDLAPKKAGDNDISYIPKTDVTTKYKKGDLMVIYDLLPDIAVQAYGMLHGLTKAKLIEQERAKREKEMATLDDREPNTDLTEED